MTNRCTNWVHETPDTSSIVNAQLLANPNMGDINFWNTMFAWTELALPSLPSYPYYGSVEVICGRLEQFGLRINITGRLLARALGDTTEGKLAMEFLCLARMLSKVLTREYQVWARRIREGKAEGALDTDLLGKTIVSLTGARSAVYTAFYQ